MQWPGFPVFIWDLERYRKSIEESSALVKVYERQRRSSCLSAILREKNSGLLMRL